MPLALAAAKMPVPDPTLLKLKTRAQYRLLSVIAAWTIPKIVTGKPLYGIDAVAALVWLYYTKCPAVAAR